MKKFDYKDLLKKFNSLNEDFIILLKDYENIKKQNNDLSYIYNSMLSSFLGLLIDCKDKQLLFKFVDTLIYNFSNGDL